LLFIVLHEHVIAGCLRGSRSGWQARDCGMGQGDSLIKRLSVLGYIAPLPLVTSLQDIHFISSVTVAFRCGVEHIVSEETCCSDHRLMRLVVGQMDGRMLTQIFHRKLSLVLCQVFQRVITVEPRDVCSEQAHLLLLLLLLCRHSLGG